MKKMTFLFLLLLSGFCLSAAKLDIKRVEPMNWWVGMNDPSLQVMVYGDKIGECRPETEYPGVTIERVVQTANPNYLFIYLNISEKAQPGVLDIHFKKNGKVQGTHSYPLLKREALSAQRKGFDSSDAIYLLMPDRFANGNPSNDSHPDVVEKANRNDRDGRHGGDIEGVIRHLDYLQELGFTALWSTPMMEDNMEKTSYHTYAITDYYKIDPRYGTNEDYKRLSAECNKRGIKLVMDVVTNHCGLAHWWMNDLPSSDWVNGFDQFTRSNFSLWTIQDPYASQVDRMLSVNGWFDISMPDLNQRNALVLDYFVQNTIWWVEYANLGGVRIDTYPYNFKEPMAELCRRIMAEYPAFNIVGECWMHEPVEVAYWQKGEQNPDGFNTQLPSVMDFPLTDALAVFTDEEQGWNTGAMRPYLNFTKDYLYPNPDNLLIFADNHDTERIWHVLKGNVDKFKLVFTILSTVRGIPQVYYGTEIKMAGEKQVGDGDIRRDFPGGWPGDKTNAFTPEGRTEEQNEVFDFVKRLLNWRKENPVVHTGAMTHFVPEENVYIYFRYNDDKKVMVVLNNANDERNVDLSRFAEMLQGVSGGKDIITGKGVVLSDQLAITAKTPMIIELDPVGRP